MSNIHVHVVNYRYIEVCMDLNNKVSDASAVSNNIDKELVNQKSELEKQVEQATAEVMLHTPRQDEATALSSVAVKDHNEERMLRFKQICDVLFTSNTSNNEQNAAESQGMWVPLLQSLIGDFSSNIQENIQALSSEEAQMICAQVYQLNLPACRSIEDLAIKAAENNCPNFLKLLLDSGVNVETIDPYGNTLLMLAALQGQASNVRVLVKVEANLEATDYYGRSALTAAALRGHVDVVKELKKNHAHIDSVIDEVDAEGQTRLMHAILAGQENVALALIEAGADVDVRNQKGQTALLCAAENGHTSILSALIEADVNVHMHDREGNTALMLAARAGHLKAVQILREALVGVEERNKQGHTALMLAVAYDQKHIVEALLQKTPGGRAAADINACCKDGSAFMFAVKNDHIEMMEIFKRADADIELTDQNGCTALAYEVSINGAHTEMANVLRELGASSDYASEFLRRKFLAHVWGVKGQSNLTNQAGVEKKIKLEGMHSKYAMRNLYKYAKEFFNNNELADRSVLKENQNKIIEACANSFPLSTNLRKAVEAIHVHDPLIILEGTEAHAISMVLCKNELFICNRGDGRKADAVERYVLPAALVTEELLETLTQQYADVGAFNRMIAGLRLKSLKGFNQKDQKVGNCTWASGKGALGILCRVYADPNWGTATEGANEATERGHALYKKFTSFAREKAYRDYLKEAPKEVQDTYILESIQSKKERKAAVSASNRVRAKPAAQVRSFFQKITSFKKVI